jgi:anti-sigma regulatory factor (Ser/Thr protein kinase)
MRLIEGSLCIAGEEHGVELALREALNNAVVHGNRQDARKLVHVRCRCKVGSGISLAVSDQGHGFDATAIPDAVTVENLESEHGRGIQLMKWSMDEVSFQQRGTEVHMCKRSARSPRADLRSDSCGSQQAVMDTQGRRIGTWCSWGVVLLSWIGFLLVLALMFRATGCNRSSEAGTPADDRAWTTSLNRWASRRDLTTAPLQPMHQGSLSSPPLSLFGSKRRNRPRSRSVSPSRFVARRAASQN